MEKSPFFSLIYNKKKTNKMTTNFYMDIKKGKTGEKIFKEDYLEYNKIKYKDVSTIKCYQKLDVDFITESESYEIKSNYKDNEWLYLEEFTNINRLLGDINLGWLAKCKATTIVFISKQSRDMIFLKFNNEFKTRYKEIRKDYHLFRNDISYRYDMKWQSAYRYIPLYEFEGLYKKYNKQDETTFKD